MHVKWSARCINLDAYSASQRIPKMELLIPTPLSQNTSIFHNYIKLYQNLAPCKKEEQSKTKETNKNTRCYPSFVLIPYSLDPIFNLSASSMVFLSKTYCKSIHISLSSLKTHLFCMTLSITWTTEIAFLFLHLLKFHSFSVRQMQ